jgi:hypothetical protein
MIINAATRLKASEYEVKLHKASDLFTRLNAVFRNKLSLNKVDASICVKDVSVVLVLKALQRMGYDLRARGDSEAAHILSLNGTPELQVQSPREDWDPVISFV